MAHQLYTRNDDCRHIGRIGGPELIQVANGRNLLWFGIGGFFGWSWLKDDEWLHQRTWNMWRFETLKTVIDAVITFMVIGAITVHFTKLLGA